MSIIEKTKKIFSYSVGSIVFISLISALFGLFKKGNMLKIVFNANYIIASVILAVGIFTFFLPVSLRSLKKSKKLVDHSNVTDVLREEKEVKTEEALLNIFWGISNIILVGIVEIIVYTFI